MSEESNFFVYVLKDDKDGPNSIEKYPIVPLFSVVPIGENLYLQTNDTCMSDIFIKNYFGLATKHIIPCWDGTQSSELQSLETYNSLKNAISNPNTAAERPSLKYNIRFSDFLSYDYIENIFINLIGQNDWDAFGLGSKRYNYSNLFYRFFGISFYNNNFEKRNAGWLTRLVDDKKLFRNNNCSNFSGYTYVWFDNSVVGTDTPNAIENLNRLFNAKLNYIKSALQDVELKPDANGNLNFSDEENRNNIKTALSNAGISIDSFEAYNRRLEQIGPFNSDEHADFVHDFAKYLTFQGFRGNYFDLDFKVFDERKYVDILKGVELEPDARGTLNFSNELNRKNIKTALLKAGVNTNARHRDIFDVFETIFDNYNEKMPSFSVDERDRFICDFVDYLLSLNLQNYYYLKVMNPIKEKYLEALTKVELKPDTEGELNFFNKDNRMNVITALLNTCIEVLPDISNMDSYRSIFDNYKPTSSFPADKKDDFIQDFAKYLASQKLQVGNRFNNQLYLLQLIFIQIMLDHKNYSSYIGTPGEVIIDEIFDGIMRVRDYFLGHFDSENEFFAAYNPVENPIQYIANSILPEGLKLDGKKFDLFLTHICEIYSSLANADEEIPVTQLTLREISSNLNKNIGFMIDGVFCRTLFDVVKTYNRHQRDESAKITITDLKPLPQNCRIITYEEYQQLTSAQEPEHSTSDSSTPSSFKTESSSDENIIIPVKRECIKISGTTLTTFGILALALGIAAQACSFGIPNPISIALMATGGTLIAAGSGMLIYRVYKNKQEDNQALNFEIAHNNGNDIQDNDEQNLSCNDRQPFSERMENAQEQAQNLPQNQENDTGRNGNQPSRNCGPTFE